LNEQEMTMMEDGMSERAQIARLEEENGRMLRLAILRYNLTF
jgi:hypothetical protein